MAAETTAALAKPAQAPDLRRLHLKSLDLEQYKTSDPENSPVRFWKNAEGDQVIQFLDHIAPVHKKPDGDPFLEERWWPWDKAKSVVMIDRDQAMAFDLMAAAQVKGLAVILEGPPAVSKTFGAWAFATAIGLPYERLNFSPGTKAYDIIGRKLPGRERVPRFPLDEIAGLPFVSENAEAKAFISELQKKRDGNIHILELERLSGMLGVQLIDVLDYVYEKTNTMEMWKRGGMIAWDEPNLADTAVFEAANVIMEPEAKKWNIPGNPEGPLLRHPNFFLVLCQNPPSVGGRNMLTGPVESRVQMIKLPAVTKERLTNLYHFFMTGEQPKFRHNGHDYQAPSVTTQYMDIFKGFPFQGQVEKAFAGFNMRLLEMVERDELRQNPLDGGAYAYDMRAMTKTLDAVVAAINGYRVQPGGGTLQRDMDWSSILQAALIETYEKGAQREDQPKIRKEILDMPLWAMLSGKNAKVPDWAIAAAANGQVTMTGKGQVVVR